MSTEPPFPILLLPFVALCEVLKFTHLMEIVSLSFCSRKTTSLIKICRDKTITWDIKIFGAPHRMINLINKRHKKVLQVRATLKNEYVGNVDKIEGSEFSIAYNYDFMRIITLWDQNEWVDGFKFIINHITELFGLPITQVVVGDAKDMWIDQWIHERQTEKLKYCTYRDENETSVLHENVGNLLKKLHPTTELFLKVCLSSSFRFKENFPKVDILSISKGSWVTLENLLSMDSVHIRISESKLTSSDMNVFIKAWLDGSNSRLKYVRICSENFRSREVLKGLMNRAVLVEKSRQYRTNHSSMTFYDSYDIKRGDGFTATYMPSRSEFTITFWPDSEPLADFED